MINKDEKFGVSYLPEIGSYQTDKVEEDNALDSEISFNFENDKFLKPSDNDANKLLDSLSINFSNQKEFEGAIEAAEKEDEKVKEDSIADSDNITDTQLEETKNSQWTSNSISEFYKFLT